MCLTSFLESDVLERFGSDPVETGCLGVVAAAACKVAARDPGACPVADGGHLLEDRVCCEEAFLRLLETVTLEERAAEHEGGLADLVEEVVATLEQAESLARTLVCGVVFTKLQVHRRKASERLGGVGLRVGLHCEAEGLAQVLDRLLRLPEHELETTEVQHQAADVALVVQLLVDRLRLLRVVARDDPVAHPLGHERCLEIRVRNGASVIRAARELERRLDVLAGSLEVALAPAAARAPAENVCAKEVAGEAGSARERERLVEERCGGRDARELVAADTELEEDVGPVEIGELGTFGQLAGDEQELDCLACLAFLRPGPGLAGQGTNLELGRARS